MPAKKPMKTTSSRAIQSVKVQDMSSTIDAGADDGDAEDALAGEVAGDARADARCPGPRPMKTAPKSRP